MKQAPFQYNSPFGAAPLKKIQIPERELSKTRIPLHLNANFKLLGTFERCKKSLQIAHPETPNFYIHEENK